MEKLYDVRQGAEALNISPHTVRAWIFQRKLPVVRLGRKILLKEKDLIDLVNHGYQEPKEVKDSKKQKKKMS